VMKYFLPENYKENPVTSFDVDISNNYWNPERIKTSISYQWAAYQWANEIIKKNRIDRVVDVGCGFAYKLHALHLENPNVEFHGVDQPNAIALCRSHYSFGKWLGVDLEDNPMKPHVKFGLVICSDVIEHVGNPDILINYLKQIVVKHGYILISTVERDVLRGHGVLSCPNKAHVREWNAREFGHYLESRGLSIVQSKLLPQQKYMFERNYIIKLMKRLISLKSMRYNQVYLLKVVES